MSPTGTLQMTKRNVLRKIATVFDPLGFICPIVVLAKILLQELWTRGHDWDEQIQDELASRVGKWFDELDMLGTSVFAMWNLLRKHKS